MFERLSLAKLWVDNINCSTDHFLLTPSICTNDSYFSFSTKPRKLEGIHKGHLPYTYLPSSPYLPVN